MAALRGGAAAAKAGGVSAAVVAAATAGGGAGDGGSDCSSLVVDDRRCDAAVRRLRAVAGHVAAGAAAAGASAAGGVPTTMVMTTTTSSSSPSASASSSASSGAGAGAAEAEAVAGGASDEVLDHFAGAELAPPDAIFGLTTAYKRDPALRKLNLGVGAYRDEGGSPVVLRCVQQAEEGVLTDQRVLKVNKEYLPITGLKDLCSLAADLVFGPDLRSRLGSRVGYVQSISGTGALRLACEFFVRVMFKDLDAKALAQRPVLVPDPTWANHGKIISHAGLAIRKYRYLERSTNGLDIDGLLQDLKDAPDGSIVLLHACAHNPTGIDPTHEQWSNIADVITKKNHFPWFDSAYQGFASGDLDRDAHAIRLFADRGLQLFVSQSFSKNFGLYAERCGCLHIVSRSVDRTQAVVSQVGLIARGMYSNPPIHGALIVSRVLSDPGLTDLWHEELRGMSARIANMRQLLFDALRQRRVPGDWSHIVSQIGMFSYTGLSPEQVKYIIDKHHVYLTQDGRISMAGLNRGSIDLLADAIADAVTTLPKAPTN